MSWDNSSLCAEREWLVLYGCIRCIVCVRMCVFVFVGVYVFCGLGNGYIGLNCFQTHKNCKYCNTKTSILLFEGFNLWLDGRQTLLPWNHGDNNQTHRGVEDSKKQHKLRAIDISLSMSLSFSLSLPVCPQSVSSLLSWRLLSSSVIKAFTIQTTDPSAHS